jgi:hypothetical protein
MPLFAAWSEPVLFIASKDSARKAATSMLTVAACSAPKPTARTSSLGGKASRVRDQETLERASAAFQPIYGWPTR